MIYKSIFLVSEQNTKNILPIMLSARREHNWKFFQSLHFLLSKNCELFCVSTRMWENFESKSTNTSTGCEGICKGNMWKIMRGKSSMWAFKLTSALSWKFTKIFKKSNLLKLLYVIKYLTILRFFFLQSFEKFINSKSFQP